MREMREKRGERKVELESKGVKLREGVERGIKEFEEVRGKVSTARR